MDRDSVPWITGRASGGAALLLFSASAAMDAALDMVIRSPRFPRWLAIDLHGDVPAGTAHSS